MHRKYFSPLANTFFYSTVNSDVNRVGQSNGEAGVRDPLRINSGEAGTDMGQMGGNGGHMMSPGQEHMRQTHGHTGQDQGDMRQDTR